jgi:Negative regulator of sigma F
MNTGKFLENLVEDMSLSVPRKSLRVKNILFFGVVNLSILGIAFAFLFYLVPPDVSFETLSWNAKNFLNIKFQALFLVLALVVSTFGAFLSGVPGFFESRKRSENLFWNFSPFLFLVGWAASVLLVPEHDWPLAFEYLSELSWNWELNCSIKVFRWTLVSMLAYAALLWRLSFTNARRSSHFVSAATFSFGALVVLFQCPYDVSLHHVVWHGGPLLIISIASSLVMRKCYRL